MEFIFSLVKMEPETIKMMGKRKIWKRIDAIVDGRKGFEKRKQNKN